MQIIAAITKDRALGRDGDMLFHISDDLKRFKRITMGHPVIMGRKTFESFPKGPLPGRRNLVISRNAAYDREGIELCASLADAMGKCTDSEPFVIGGGEIYRQAMPLAETLQITEIDAESADADTFFPEIDPDIWERERESETFTDPRSSVTYRFVTYTRK